MSITPDNFTSTFSKSETDKPLLKMYYSNLMQYLTKLETTRSYNIFKTGQNSVFFFKYIKRKKEKACNKDIFLLFRKKIIMLIASLNKNKMQLFKKN